MAKIIGYYFGLASLPTGETRSNYLFTMKFTRYRTSIQLQGHQILIHFISVRKSLFGFLSKSFMFDQHGRTVAS